MKAAQFLRSYRYRDSLCATSLDVLEAGGLLPPRMAAQPAAVTVGRQPLLRTGPPPSLSGPWSWQSWGFELVVRSNKGRLKLKRKDIFILMVFMQYAPSLKYQTQNFLYLFCSACRVPFVVGTVDRPCVHSQAEIKAAQLLWWASNGFILQTYLGHAICAVSVVVSGREFRGLVA